MKRERANERTRNLAAGWARASAWSGLALAVSMGSTPAQRVEVAPRPEPAPAQTSAQPLARLSPALAGPVQRFALDVRPSSGLTKLSVAREHVAEFLASPAGVRAELASETPVALIFRVPALDVDAAPLSTGVEHHPEFDFVPLRRGMLDTRGGHRGGDVEGLPLPGATPRRNLVIAQLPGFVTDEALERVLESGAEIVHYLPQNAYLLWAPNDAVRQALRAMVGASGVLQFVDEFSPSDAVHPGLDHGFEAGPIEVTVQVFNPKHERALAADQRAAIAQVSAFAEQIYRGPTDVPDGVYTNITMRVPAEAVALLVELESVVNVEPFVLERALSERQAQEMHGALNAGQTAAGGPGYLSWLSTQSFPSTEASYPIIAIADSGVDNASTSPLDLTLRRFGLPGNASRLLSSSNFSGAATATDLHGHGHINTSIAIGYESVSGNLDGSFLRGLGINPYGRATNTKVLNDSGSAPLNIDWSAAAASSWNNGARISSNSWGGFNSGFYDVLSQLHDYLTRDVSTASGLQQQLFVFAAGNDGVSGITTPGTAKNVLTVGATEGSDATGTDGCGTTSSSADNIQQIASFSGRGPTADGRNKPDIVAPGTHVVGTRSPVSGYTGTGVCDANYPTGQTIYCRSSGTSHSTPAIAGAVSLEWNYLSRVHGLSAPSPALLKAFTLHHTRYLQSTGGNLPSVNQGYGFPWLDLGFDQTITRTLVDQSSTFNATAEYRTFSGTVSNSLRPIRIALAWTDAAGASTAAPWVNDLDLTVTVAGNTYRGNVFSGGLSTTGGTADTKNNTELVVLPTGFSGPISIKVNATNIAGDGVPGNADATDQDFALVISNVSFASGCTPPLITANPPASIAQCNSSPLNISVTASGSNLSYKFYRNGNTVQLSSSNTYSVQLPTTADAGTYTCSISNGCGDSLSAPVVVSVSEAPSPVQNPPSSAGACQGSALQLTFVASGSPAPTYQWQRNDVDIVGATSSSYTIASMQPANVGTYRCVATNACGVALSSICAVNMTTVPVFSQQPQSVSVCSGTNAQLSVALSNFLPGTSYVWLRNNVQVPGAANAVLNLSPVTAGNAGTYVCLATNSCGFTFSNQAIVTAYTLPDITTHPVSQSFCVGVGFAFSVGISNPAPAASYQWRKDGSPILGATSASYGKASATSADNGTYDCVVTNTCGSSTSSPATYTARVAPTITLQPQDTAVCAGVNGVLDVGASGTGPLSYQWFHNGVGLGWFTNSSHTLFNPSSASTGTYFCRVTNVCGTVDSNTIVVTLDAVPAIQTHPLGATVCEASPVAFDVGASGSPNLSYQWRFNGSPIGGATGASYAIAAVQAGQAGTYDCVVSSTCTSVISNAAALVVNTPPQVLQGALDTVACIGASASLDIIASGTPAPTYQWRMGGQPLAGQTSPSLYFAAVTAGDFGTYDCVVTNSCGTATSATVQLALYVPPTCVSGGPGGIVPSAGAADGAWPNLLPTGALASPLNVVVPAGATHIVSVKLNGWQHSWSGDNQLVLETPSGASINLFQQVDGVFGGGCGDDFSGDYEFVDALVGSAACGAPAASYACTQSGLVAPGTYRQFFGAWPSGAAGIDNTPLGALPLASGVYTLHVYDWYVAADSGSLASWELCFDAPAAPQAYCTAGTTTNGCAATLTASANPSASFATPCSLTAANVEGGKSGLLFYGVNGRTNAPWNGTSVLCVKAPTQRMTLQSSGGTAGACDGAFALDWNAYQLANPGALGNPFGAGGKVWVQCWFRDPPAGKTTNLSDALELTLLP
ncbi:MAG: immunoglobulin domain-containing protein [Planctomycetes bacterium]|nr:immunoglobulin domain-containing protein [Planctomycetota bacterium]